MVFMVAVPLQADVPDWLALVVVLASILLAALTLSLMVLRVRPSADDDASSQMTVRDPMLMISVLGVILLAVAAWFLR